jgi:hypothetical protein
MKKVVCITTNIFLIMVALDALLGDKSELVYMDLINTIEKKRLLKRMKWVRFYNKFRFKKESLDYVCSLTDCIFHFDYERFDFHIYRLEYEIFLKCIASPYKLNPIATHH